MALSHSLRVQLDEQLYRRLTQVAASRSLETSEAAAQAIEAWVEIDAWQRAEIEAGLAEADRGEFASEAEVAAIFTKWTGNQAG